MNEQFLILFRKDKNINCNVLNIIKTTNTYPHLFDNGSIVGGQLIKTS